IEPDEAMRIAAVGQPDIAVLVESHILADAPADERARQLAELWSIVALTRGIRWEVILHVHGLAQLGLVEGHLLVDAHCPRFAALSEVLDQVCEQVLAILAGEAERRGTITKEPFGI